MVFTSLRFVGFFLVVYALYRSLPHRGQNWLLLAASYYFYGAWDWRFLGLLVGSTVVDFAMARVIAATDDPRRRRLAVIASLTYNLGVLAFFKYFNFFESSAAELARAVGLHLDVVTLHVVLPIGISFYTFMTISYVIDVYRREIEPTRNLVDFALFVSYFPHLIAGPILRASRLLPQIARPRTITRQQIVDGLWLIAWGTFQKLFVADNLARIVSPVFDPAASPTGADVLLGVYAFAFQILGDFAGYSNIARGLSKLMGIELNVNFLFPYFVISPREFWRNWHISLSTWLRDYLYIPLGGSRGTTAKTIRNIVITMVLGGLWHGAAWTFVLWGAYQAAIQIAGRAVQAATDRLGWTIGPGFGWRRLLAGILMFHVTCYGWLVFRAESVHQVSAFTRLLLFDFRPGPDTFRALAWPMIQIVTPFVLVQIYQARRGTDLAVIDLPAPARYAVYGAVCYLILLFGNFAGAEFIYFQF
jgi:D-alanyl-lipoteichoic acid acyltransferase DltB (MBOAT superfamily)